MPSVALVSYDVQSVKGQAGGVGAFVTHLARLLKDAGEDVTIVFVSASTSALHIDREAKERYAGWGIDVLEVHTPAPTANRWKEAWPARLSEEVAPHLRRFDVVYLQDWANAGFHAIRERRFSPGGGPVFVTVLHGPSRWVHYGNRQFPAIPEDPQMAFIERYAAEHSDRVVAPSQYMACWLEHDGWRLRREPVVLGLPYWQEDAPCIASVSTRGRSMARLVFFGRLEIRKGFEIFTDALRLLCTEDPSVLGGLEEIVLLGQEREPGAVAALRRLLAITGVAVTHLSDLDSSSARSYLIAHACDSLVVIPSPFENFPYTVIEALSIPGLNVICSRGGGIPEVFGSEGEAQMFEPSPPALAARLAERLRDPLKPEQLAAYDCWAANARWLRFHRGVCAEGVCPSLRRGTGRPSVDVCIPYYNKGKYFQQLLLALTAQTEKDFGVIAIDDGSTDPHSRLAFDAAARENVDRGWKFLRQPNAFVDAARNRAAQLSSADYLLFLDPDDIPVTNAVERLLNAAVASGVDCLTSGGWLFDSDQMPFDLETGRRQVPHTVSYMPLGPDLVGGIVDPMVFGLPMILIRRAAFETVGGYRESRGACHEDWELQIRLLRAGFQTDVLPECLLYFRRPADGLTRTGEVFPARWRLVETYDSALREAGMPGLAAAVFRLDQRCHELQQQLIRNVPRSLRMQLNESRDVERQKGPSH